MALKDLAATAFSLTFEMVNIFISLSLISLYGSIGILKKYWSGKVGFSWLEKTYSLEPFLSMSPKLINLIAPGNNSQSYSTLQMASYKYTILRHYTFSPYARRMLRSGDIYPVRYYHSKNELHESRENHPKSR